MQFSTASTSMSVPMKQRKASSGVHTIGSPRTLKLVLTTTGQPVSCLEAPDQRVVARVGLAVHRLDARRIIDMRHRRDGRARNVELVDAEQRVCSVGHARAAFLLYIGDQQHVRAVVVDARTSRPTSSRSTEGANGRNDSRYLTFRLRSLLHRRRAGIAEDRAAAQRARAELHAALEPADRLAVGQRLGADIRSFSVVGRVAKAGTHGGRVAFRSRPGCNPVRDKRLACASRPPLHGAVDRLNR